MPYNLSERERIYREALAIVQYSGGQADASQVENVLSHRWTRDDAESRSQLNRLAATAVRGYEVAEAMNARVTYRPRRTTYPQSGLLDQRRQEFEYRVGIRSTAPGSTDADRGVFIVRSDKALNAQEAFAEAFRQVDAIVKNDIYYSRRTLLQDRQQTQVFLIGVFRRPQE